MDDSDEPPNDLLADARCRLRSPSGSGRNLSRQELAEAVNAYLWDAYRITETLDGTYVGHLEQGRHRWPRSKRREAFRKVLGVDTDAEIGFYITRGTTRGSALARLSTDEVGSNVNRRRFLEPVAAAVLVRGTHTKVAELVMALTSYADVDPGVVTANDVRMEDLSERVATARSDYQHGRYSMALGCLPGLLTDLRRVASHDERARHRRWVLTAETYQVASGLLLKADDPTLASVAADRSISAAYRSGDPLTIASSTRAVVHTLLASGHPARAAELAVNAAERLLQASDRACPEVMSLYGALLLRGAVAAARDEDRQLTIALLAEADGVAARIGRDSNTCWTAFGPSNVQLHRVATAVDLGDAGTAISIAADVDPASLPIPERRAALMIDTARAFTQWGKYQKALDAIHSAERYAPEEVRSRRSVHTLIGDIIRRAPAPVQRQARAYAHRVGAPQ